MSSVARRSSRIAPAIVATALIAGAAFATPAHAETAPVPTASSATDTVRIAVAPAGGGVVAAGSDLSVTVEITNPTSADLAAGSVELALDASALTDADTLEAWLDGPAEGSDAAVAAGGTATVEVEPVGAAATPGVAAGATETVQLTVPAAELDLGAWGVHPFEATLTVDGTAQATATGSIVARTGRDDPVAAGVTVIAPLTSVPSTTGLIQAAALEAYTNDTGVLTRELDAVVDRRVTIAVDPRIIVSIRALGSTAPASAVAWLERLAQASNPIIPLSYADSDLAGQQQAGAPAVLQPTSFAYALLPKNFTDVSDLIEPTSTPSATSEGSAPAAVDPAGPGAPTGSGTAPETEATPSPTPTPAPTAEVPTLEQLLDWDYTSTAIAWPRAGTATAAALPFFAASGLTSTLLDSQQVIAGDGPALPLDATATAEGGAVLVADHGVSRAMQDVLAATGDVARGEAVSELASTLGLAAQAGPQDAAAAESGPGGSGTARQVIAVLDRDSMNLQSIDQVLGAVDALPWIRSIPLQAVLDRAPTQSVSVVDAPESEERLAQIRTLLGGANAIDAFATIAADPARLTGETRADLLALLSNSWVANQGGWNVAVDTAATETADLLDSVAIVEGSDINLLSNQAPLPVTISNDLDQPVTVTVHVTTSNGRLVIDENDVPVTVEANSRKGAQIPVTAVANGSVTLSFQLLGPNGELISNPSPVTVNVSADWETWGTVFVAIAVVLVFGAGIVRLTLKRRKARGEGAETDG